MSPARQKFKVGNFVTTSSFSRHAKKFAKGMNVELIDGQSLVQMIAGIRDFPTPVKFARYTLKSAQ